MLPARNRLHHAAEFRAVMRSGVRKGRSTVVVHALAHPAVVERTGGPRWGLVVSKAVGNSVERHRMSRRLRHICRELDAEEYVDLDFVVRALPPSRAADAATLRGDVLGAARSAAEKARNRRDGSASGESGRRSSSSSRAEDQ